MLKQSVQAWNGLRKSDPAYVPDLCAADLEGRDLSGADLRLADLRGAYLNGAKLAGSDLRRADLRRAHLTYVDFTGADLTGADLRGADLHGAELQGAKLEGALVTETILDPDCWTKPLLALWREAAPGRRERLVQALEGRTALHRHWLDESAGSPEAILSERGAATDDFTFAWDTYGISEELVLRVLTAANCK
ncbi:MAG TPA: pentapeptide repeat-containing protein [Bryobacteraceae bacterium]|nr:pentapeptide repeat-containing protein [Bryobacteraceae bacterium]